MPQSEPTLAVCLDADRLDLGRVWIIPDPLLLSISTAKAIVNIHDSVRGALEIQG